MKRLLLFLLLLASIGCKKELAPQGEQRDYNTANYENGEGRYALFMRYTYDFYWRGDGGRGITPERMRLDVEGSLILGLGDTSRDEAMQNLIGCETQVLMRHGDGKYSDNVLTFTKKRVGSYLIRDGDIIESIDYNTLQTLPAIQVGATAAHKYHDLEINTSNNCSYRHGTRTYFAPTKFAKWVPINRYYFLE